MALALNICQTARLADCSEFTLTDQTGDYNATTNPGGYGTPNEGRSTLALHILGYKYVEGATDEDITALLNNTDPENVTSWSVPNTADGYYYFDILAVDIWDASVSYVVGDLVEYQGTYYKTLIDNLNSPPSDINTDWEIITDLSEEISNTSLADYQRYHMVNTCRVEYCYGNVVHDSNAICQGCQDCQGKILKLYQKLDVLFQSIFINIDQDNWTKADLEVRTMIGYCQKTDCRVC